MYSLSKVQHYRDYGSTPYGKRSYYLPFLKHDQAELIELKLDSKKKNVTLPLFCKETNGLLELYSWYGYLSYEGNYSLAKEDILELEQFLERIGVIRLFLRHCPISCTHLRFPKEFSEFNRHTYVIRLPATINLDKSSLYSKFRYSFRKCLKQDILFEVFELKNLNQKTLKEIKNIYQAMVFEKGSKYLLLSDEYFDLLREGSSAEDFVCLAKCKDQIMAFSIFLAGKDYITYHLSAAKKSFPQLPLSDALMLEALKRVKALGIPKVYLGGGLRKDSSDGLSKFKKKFATDVLPYHITNLQLNHNQEMITRKKLGVKKENLMIWEALHENEKA